MDGISLEQSGGGVWLWLAIFCLHHFRDLVPAAYFFYVCLAGSAARARYACSGAALGNRTGDTDDGGQRYPVQHRHRTSCLCLEHYAVTVRSGNLHRRVNSPFSLKQCLTRSPSLTAKGALFG